MKSIRIFLAGTLATGAALVAVALPPASAGAADTAAATAAAPAGPRGWEGGPHGGGPLHMYSKLGLTAAQQASMKSVLAAAEPNLKSLHTQLRANDEKLRQTSPDDPNYATVVSDVSQAHGTLEAQLVSQRAELRSQLYALLTPAQKTQLAALEAQWKANGPRHWNGGHRGPPPDADGGPAGN